MIYRFGRFQLDTKLLELQRDENPVTIVPQAFDVLRLLIESRDRVVSRNELIEKVWNGRIVSEAALSSCINAVRRAVDDDGKRQNVIRTMPRRGFRFVPPATIDRVAQADPEGERADPENADLPLVDRNLGPSISGNFAIAVLPFLNMSDEPDQEYFADGLTEDVIIALSQWRSFPVIARNSSFPFKDRSPDIRKFGAEIGARYVMEGSVRKSGNRVRVAVQLIDAETGYHVWAERYDRDLVDIFELQDELTQTIVSIVAPKVERTEHRRLRSTQGEQLDAGDYVLTGMASLNELTQEGNIQAREFFKKAIDLDPDYSRPYTGLGWSHIREVSLDFTESSHDDLVAGVTATKRAIELDPSDGLAHSVLSIGYMLMRVTDLSLLEAKEAVRLNPSDSHVHVGLGQVLSLAGHSEDAVLSLEKAFRLNPHDPKKSFHLCFMSRAKFNMGHYDDAIEWARKSIALRPDIAEPHLLLAVTLGHLGRIGEARIELRKYEEFEPSHAAKGGVFPYAQSIDTDHFLEGLGKAGWKN